MTQRTTRKDVDAAVARLNRNTALGFSVMEYNGYIHLHNADGSVAYSNGNTKSELYWQVQLANKVIEAMRDKNQETILRNYSKGFTKENKN